MKTKHTNATEIYLKAMCGSDMFECIREAVVVCAEQNVDCVISHNGVEVEVSVWNLVSSVYEEWEKKLEASRKEKN